MSKIIVIKLTKGNTKVGPFTITDQYGNIIASDVPRSVLVKGISYTVNSDVSVITLTSEGDCSSSRSELLTTVSPSVLKATTYTQTSTSCLWRHLTNVSLFNSYYGITSPYVIEYPFAYQYQDEILQNIKSYDKVFKYVPDGTGVYSYTDKISVDNEYFNKLIVYNNQQCSGVLELAPKPLHNMKEYMKYPIYTPDSRIILYTKSDNFYQINDVYDVVKDKSKQLFITSCESLSKDAEINQSNMIYTQRSFKKSPMRAKDSKIRLILDNTSGIHIVSQLFTQSSQISYK